MRPVCAAVQAAHQRHLIHRDLKAENIFIVRGAGGEIPKVLDFGLAKLLAASQLDITAMATVDTGADVLVGTPQYMAPEQLKGEAASTSWDVGALTVIAYEALTGMQPFASGRSIAEVHNAISNGRFVPISEYLPDASSRMCSFFPRAFSLIATERTQSAPLLWSELALALEQTRGVPA